jgi:hypothetical protein
MMSNKTNIQLLIIKILIEQYTLLNNDMLTKLIDFIIDGIKDI